jgi:glycerol kinase
MILKLAWVWKNIPKVFTQSQSQRSYSLFIIYHLLLSVPLFLLVCDGVSLFLKHISDMCVVLCLFQVKELYREGKLMIGTLDTWLMWKLSDGSIYATDDSNASTTGMYDPYVKTFSSLLWFLAELPPKKVFPPLYPTSGHFGLIAPHLFGYPIPIGGIHSLYYCYLLL